MFETLVLRKNSLPVLSFLAALGYLSYVLIPLLLTPGFGKGQNDLPVDIRPTVLLAQHRQQPLDYAEISNWHLFGQVTDDSSSANANLPATQLQLKLQGVLTSGARANFAHAIITTADQNQKAYKINDELPGGATLKAIEKDQIILVGINGQESLALEKQASK